MVSRMTAYTIATNENVKCAAGGPSENGKWTGWITLDIPDRFHPLLNTKPIYDSEKEAVAAMKKIVLEIKKVADKELKGRHPIDAVFEDIAKIEEGK